MMLPCPAGSTWAIRLILPDHAVIKARTNRPIPSTCPKRPHVAQQYSRAQPLSRCLTSPRPCCLLRVSYPESAFRLRRTSSGSCFAVCASDGTPRTGYAELAVGSRTEPRICQRGYGRLVPLSSLRFAVLCPAGLRASPAGRRGGTERHGEAGHGAARQALRERRSESPLNYCFQPSTC